jgi:hypothetical protein
MQYQKYAESTGKIAYPSILETSRFMAVNTGKMFESLSQVQVDMAIKSAKFFEKYQKSGLMNNYNL